MTTNTITLDTLQDYWEQDSPPGTGENEVITDFWVIHGIAVSAGITHNEAAKFLREFVLTVRAALVNGDYVEIGTLGRFTAEFQKGAGTPVGGSPAIQTTDEKKVFKDTYVRFSASDQLRDALN
jgi:nucleoid DNA-binding protein